MAARYFVTFALAFACTDVRADGRFDDLRARAEKLDGISGFLERYIGNCKDPAEMGTCQQNAGAVRQQFQGKTLLVTVNESAGFMKAETGDGHFRILVTPFIDGGGYALTHGTPKKLDAAGNPLIDLIVVAGNLPDGVGDMEFRNAFRTGNVSLELVFQPQGVWRIKRRGEDGTMEGVRSKFVGLRLINRRTGAEIATKTL